MREHPPNRRLTAIVATDIAEYSRLMEVDEEQTLSCLNALHNEILLPRISANGGRVIKLMGDGLLAAFDTASDAVSAALQVQRMLASVTTP